MILLQRWNTTWEIFKERRLCMEMDGFLKGLIEIINCIGKVISTRPVMVILSLHLKIIDQLENKVNIGIKL
jgi:hypothetical protein